MKNILICIMITALLIMQFSLTVFAHDAYLTISYDDCVPAEDEDGYYEKWYMLRNGIGRDSEHFPHAEQGVTTIKYYIADSSTGHSWDINDLEPEDIEILYTGIQEGIEKWDKIYFYQIDSDNIITRRKLVNVELGTSSDYNVLIVPSLFEEYPGTPMDEGYSAPFGECLHYEDVMVEQFNIGEHIHANKWEIYINLERYKLLNSYSKAYMAECTTAHEMGHVLGLADIEFERENPDHGGHHDELLMGYESVSIRRRQKNVTYKDLVGVAITRGYHTDDDHKWLYDASSSSVGNNKLICTVCNGVKYVESLYGYSYDNYKECNNQHGLSYGNMMAVASYDNKDYYKCKYCRYVAPFESCIEQDWEISVNAVNKIINNRVEGLEYTIIEKHVWNENYECVDCGYQHVHTYSPNIMYISPAFHGKLCHCGAITQKGNHCVTYEDAHDGNAQLTCIGCGALLRKNIDTIIIQSEIKWVSENGSYISPDGIVVLVDGDIEAYLVGDLIFYDKNSSMQ